MTQWTAQMTQQMRSWKGLWGQPLRGPASGRSLERGDDPESTESHVSHFNYWTNGIIYYTAQQDAIRCMSKHCKTQVVSSYSSERSLLPFYFSSWLHSEEDTEEWSDDRGGERSRLVKWFGDAGVSWARILLDIKTLEALSLPHPMPTPNTATHSSLAWH